VLVSHLEEQHLTRYLLGELAGEEQARVEEEYFADDAFFECLCAVEEELICAYLQGRLPEPRRRRFEEVYSAPPRWRRVEAARAWVAAATAVRGGTSSFWRRLLALLREQSPALRLGMAGVALMVLAGGGWLAWEAQRLKARLEVARTERAVLEGKIQDLRQRADPPLLSFVLTPGLVRGAEQPKKLAIPAGEYLVHLHVILDSERQYAGVHAALRTAEGVEVWSQETAEVASTTSGTAVDLRLPARVLAGNDYVLSVQGLRRGAREDVGSYYFRVVRR